MYKSLGMIFVTHKFQGHRVDAVALVTWWWSVIENVSQVGVAAGTQQFDTTHAVIVVRALANVCRIQFSMKTWPSTTRVELALRAEQGVVAADTVIISGFNMVAILPAERGLCTGLAGHSVLLGIQLILPLPWFLDDLFHIAHCKGQTGREPFARWMYLTMLKSHELSWVFFADKGGFQS